MAQGINEIDLTAHWENAQESLEDWNGLLKDLIRGLNNLKELPEELEYDRDELVERLEFLEEENEINTGDFDYIFNEIYDLVDTPLDARWNGKKLAWIKTF